MKYGPRESETIVYAEETNKGTCFFVRDWPSNRKQRLPYESKVPKVGILFGW